MQTLNKYLLVTLIFCSKSYALEKIYFGDGVKDVFVNSNESTLLLFPSPPIARVCQPSGVIELFPIESKEEIERMSLAQGSELLEGFKSKSKSDPTEYMLKLSPHSKDQHTNCDIKLSSGETVSLRFKTMEALNRPFIEFKNIFEKDQKSQVSSNQDAALVFQKLVSGGELVEFIKQDIQTNAISSKVAKYELIYVSTNRDNFKLWTYKVIPKTKLEELPVLKNVKVNEIFYSSWLLELESKSIGYLEINRKSRLMILSSNDITQEEMARKLP